MMRARKDIMMMREKRDYDDTSIIYKHLTKFRLPSSLPSSFLTIHLSSFPTFLSQFNVYSPSFRSFPFTIHFFIPPPLNPPSHVNLHFTLHSLHSSVSFWFALKTYCFIVELLIVVFSSFSFFKNYF